MNGFWWGIVVGAAAVGLIGGPVASRLSARLEASWDRAGDAMAGADSRFARLVEQLAVDEPQFAAYQAQYWSWAAIVGGVVIGIAVAGSLLAWALSGENDGLAALIAAGTAVVVGGIMLFWIRKLIAKRRVTRLVYRRRREMSR